MAAKPKTTKPGKQETIQIGLSEKVRSEGVALLAGILADQHVLYIKTRNFHWNLIGHRFHSLHELFEQQYNALALAIDRVAERIRMLGAVSPGSMAELMKLATIEESLGSEIDGSDAVATLLEDHERAIRELRKAVARLGEIEDAGTEDFVISLMQQHEEIAWMLRALNR